MSVYIARFTEGSSSLCNCSRGTRGGNRAIIITTRRGKYTNGRKRLGVTVSTGVEISEVNKLAEMQDRYLQGNGGLFSTFVPDVSDGTPNSWGPRTDTAGIPFFDKYKDFFKTALPTLRMLRLRADRKKKFPPVFFRLPE